MLIKNSSIKDIDLLLCMNVKRKKLIGKQKILIFHLNFFLNEIFLIFFLNEILYYIFFNKSALTLAVENDLNEFVELLLANKNIDVNFISKSTIKETELEEVDSYDECILEHKKTYEKYNRHKEETPLTIALNNENIHAAQLLLSNPEINVNIVSISKDIFEGYKEEPPLIIAINKKYMGIVRLILSNHKYDANCKFISEDNNKENHIEKSLLFIAIDNDYVDIVRSLLSNPEIDVKYKYTSKNTNKQIETTCLHLAVADGNTEMVQVLLDSKKVDVNARDSEKRTPMDLVIKKNIKDMLEKYKK